MYSATNKIIFYTTIAAMSLSMISCDSENRRERKACEQLIQEATTQIQSGNYVEAFALMDSVDKAYPRQVDARREVTLMRSKAMIDYSQAQLIATDSLITVLESKMAQLTPKMQHVDGDDIAGYYVAKSVYNPNFLSTTGIEGRVDDETLSFYLVAVNNQKHIGVNQLKFSNLSGDVLTSAIEAQSERSGDLDPNGIDLASFLPEEIGEIINMIEEEPSRFNALALIGKKGGEVPVKFTKEQAMALIDTWQFADAVSRLQRAKWLHDKFEQQLVVARDHTVNLEE